MELTTAEQSHRAFLDLKEMPIAAFEIQHQKNKKSLRAQMKWFEQSHQMGMDAVKKILTKMNLPEKHIEGTLEALGDKRSLKFAKWLDKETNHNFYFFGAYDNEVGLITRDLQSSIVLKLCLPSSTIANILGNQAILQIEAIHSDKKGEGYKVMKKVLSFADRHELPVTLWTETEGNVKYFARYGFKNYGRCGENQEYLMILEKEKGK